jgi:hypothetical protein
MTPEQIAHYVQVLGWTPDQVVDWYQYFATGQPG